MRTQQSEKWIQLCESHNNFLIHIIFPTSHQCLWWSLWIICLFFSFEKNIKWYNTKDGFSSQQEEFYGERRGKLERFSSFLSILFHTRWKHNIHVILWGKLDDEKKDEIEKNEKETNTGVYVYMFSFPTEGNTTSIFPHLQGRNIYIKQPFLFVCFHPIK